MANYDRRILVPYLQDVCSVEMLCNKTERELGACRTDINNMSRDINIRLTMPVRPPTDPSAYRNADDEDSIPVFTFWTIASVIAAILVFAFAGFNFFVFVFLASTAFWGFLAISEKNRTDYNREVRCQGNMEYYEQQVKQYNEQVNYQAQLRSLLPKYQQYERQLIDRQKEERTLRERIYSVNIIPARYRNIYAAYYLYDYFSTCRENDLDKIIQTMLLDEIKQRLDKVIVQNEEILLNQRVQIALQEQSNKMIAENHRREMQQLARMEKNQETQMDYQRMITANQEVTNFFLAADYLRKN